MPTGAVELAWMTGAAVVLGFVTRSTAGRYRIVLREVPVRTRKDGSGDRAADVEAGMRSVVSELERGIAETPEQWFALSPIWGVFDPSKACRLGCGGERGRGDLREFAGGGSGIGRMQKRGW